MPADLPASDVAIHEAVAAVHHAISEHSYRRLHDDEAAAAAAAVLRWTAEQVDTMCPAGACPTVPCPYAVVADRVEAMADEIGAAR
jgi:hypothetical protein